VSDRENPWKDIELGEVIAERTLFLDGADTVRVQIGEPVLADAPHGDSACPWLIEGMGSSRLRYAVGIDRVQALWLALQMIGVTLYLSKEYKSGRLKAFADCDDRGDLGFPVTENCRDLLPEG